MKLHNSSIGLIVGSLMALGSSLPVYALTSNILNVGGTIGTSTSQDFSFNFNTAGTYQVDNVTLDISSLTHADLSQLELYLISPIDSGSKTLTIATKNSLSGTTMTSTVLSDIGNAIDTGSSPYTNTYSPVGGDGTAFNFPSSNFSFADTFAGISPTGVWNLRIYNNDASNSATLGNVTLNVTATAVPFDFSATPGLLLLGLWGIQGQIKKRYSVSMSTNTKDSTNFPKS